MAANLKRKRATDVSDVETEKAAGDDTEMTDLKDGEDSETADEEAEWGGVVQAENDMGDATHSGTIKPPTGEELRVIKDAAELFQSSSFKLQIDALLPNVRPKPSRITPLNHFLHTLHTFLTSLPSVPPRHPLIAAQELQRNGVAIPYVLPLPTEDTNWKVGFEKPGEILLVGSWPNNLGVKGREGGFGVDLGVEMPDTLFQEKDYLNARFFQKKAFFLAVIAAAVIASKGELNVDAWFESVGDDPRLTTLMLVPRKDDSLNDFSKLNAHIRVIPILSPTSPMPLRYLSPSRSNIRSSTNTDSAPTPLYNTAFLLSHTPRPHLLATHALKESTPAFSDALALLNIWAIQRGYCGGGRGWSVRGFEGRGPWWAGVLRCVVEGEEGNRGKKQSGQRRAMGRGLSSYQLFRAGLDFMAKWEFAKEGIYLKTKDGHRFPPEEYEASHETVFVDSTSLVNLLAGVPLSSLELLRSDARRTLEVLNESSFSSDPFAEVFLKEQTTLPTRVDTVIRVDFSSAKPRDLSVHSTLDCGSSTNALLASLASLLRHGLGTRAMAIAILHPPSSRRPLSQAHPSSAAVINIGLVHDPEHAFRLVDHGPAADDPDPHKAQRFRDFWGDKAELRRFKDGRIIESVVWDVQTSDDRTQVPSMIVSHVLQRHFGIGGDSVKTWQAPFDAVLRMPESVAKVYQSAGVPTGFKAAMTAFDELAKGLRTIDDELPLALSNVSPASESLRYTSVFAPVPMATSVLSVLPLTAHYAEPMEIVLQFEKSSKWPDDLKAIQKVKFAFFERIADVLMASMEGTKASVVVGDGHDGSAILDQARLEVILKQGWVFSMRIWHDREATLLDRVINDKANGLSHIRKQQQQQEDTNAGKTKEALLAREVYMRRFIHAPRHHRAIASLCHRFSAFSGTVRLVKRWLASHWLLSGHVSEEVVEILCAAVFVGDGKVELESGRKVSVPGSKERGFATVVEFLKEWQWEEGLFVPLYGGNMTEETQVTSVKTGVKLGVWTVSTEVDKEGLAWTRNSPDGMAAWRIRALANATWESLRRMADGDLDVKSLFVHPTDDYDFVVHLDRAVLSRYFQNVNVNEVALAMIGKYANLPTANVGPGTLLRPGFDIAQCLYEDLKRVYRDTLKFFYDPFGGDRIGAVWDPSLRNPRPFRVLGGFSSMPKKASGLLSSRSDGDFQDIEKGKDKRLVVVNEAAILREIERLGLGIIKGIEGA